VGFSRGRNDSHIQINGPSESRSSIDVAIGRRWHVFQPLSWLISISQALLPELISTSTSVLGQYHDKFPLLTLAFKSLRNRLKQPRTSIRQVRDVVPRA
jgi:hypothetical protein